MTSLVRYGNSFFTIHHQVDPYKPERNYEEEEDGFPDIVMEQPGLLGPVFRHPAQYDKAEYVGTQNKRYAGNEANNL